MAFDSYNCSFQGVIYLVCNIFQISKNSPPRSCVHLEMNVGHLTDLSQSEIRILQWLQLFNFAQWFLCIKWLFHIRKIFNFLPKTPTNEVHLYTFCTITVQSSFSFHSGSYTYAQTSTCTCLSPLTHMYRPVHKT